MAVVPLPHADSTVPGFVLTKGPGGGKAVRARVVAVRNRRRGVSSSSCTGMWALCRAGPRSLRTAIHS